MTGLPVVSARTRLGLEILAFGAAGGVIGDALLRAMPWGLNVALGTAGLVGAGAWLVRRHRITPGPDAAWLAITALLLGAAFVRRDAAELAQFDMLALVGALAFAAASLQGERIMRWSVIDYLRAGVTASVSSVVGGLILVGRDIDWHEMPREGRLRHLRGVLAGVVIAAPLLVVFAALFASADPVFANVLQNLFAFDAASIVQHTFFIFFWGALTAGWLRWSLIGRPVAAPKLDYIPSSVTPFVVALGLLNALFLLFVVVQLRYLFGIEIPGFHYQKLRDLARTLERLSGVPVPPTAPGIGLNVFSHESGIHTAGMLIHPAIYQFIPPADLGEEVRYVYGKHSGAVVIEHALRTNHVAFDSDLVGRVMNEVKRIREERAERADYYAWSESYYDHLEGMGVSEEEVVEIATALSEKPTA